MNGLQKIIDIFDGNKTAVAKKLAVETGNDKLCAVHINNWLSRDKKVPDLMAIPLAKISGWAVKPHELRLDLYPHPEDGLPEELRAPRKQVA
jgi:hypothetical protein